MENVEITLFFYFFFRRKRTAEKNGTSSVREYGLTQNYYVFKIWLVIQNRLKWRFRDADGRPIRGRVSVSRKE